MAQNELSTSTTSVKHSLDFSFIGCGVFVPDGVLDDQERTVCLQLYQGHLYKGMCTFPFFSALLETYVSICSFILTFILSAAGILLFLKVKFLTVWNERNVHFRYPIVYRSSSLFAFFLSLCSIFIAHSLAITSPLDASVIILMMS